MTERLKSYKLNVYKLSADGLWRGLSPSAVPGTRICNTKFPKPIDHPS